MKKKTALTLEKEYWDGSGISREYQTSTGKWYYVSISVPSDVQKMVQNEATDDQLITAKEQLAIRYYALNLNELFSELMNSYVHFRNETPVVSSQYKETFDSQNRNVVAYVQKNEKNVDVYKKLYTDAEKNRVLQNFTDYNHDLKKQVQDKTVRFSSIDQQMKTYDVKSQASSNIWRATVPVLFLIALVSITVVIFKRR